MLEGFGDIGEEGELFVFDPLSGGLGCDGRVGVGMGKGQQWVLHSWLGESGATVEEPGWPDDSSVPAKVNSINAPEESTPVEAPYGDSPNCGRAVAQAIFIR